MDRSKLYINSKELNKLVDRNKIYIFGAGVMGECLLADIASKENVIAFVDNCKTGRSNTGYPIIKFDEFKNQMGGNHKIVISTMAFSREICSQLEENGFKPISDFYIWDKYYEHCCDPDIESFIVHNQKLWGGDKETKKNKIIIPFENVHDVSAVMLAYCSNYLAEKYNADIYCYSRDWNGRVEESVWNVYKSFGVKAIISTELSEKRKNDAECIAESIWKEIKDGEDWKNISIFDISFGTTMIRDYLRFYMPYLNCKDERIKPWFLEVVRRIVFWHDFVNENNVKALIMWDGVHREGYLRDIAISKGIPAYAVHYVYVGRLSLNETHCKPYKYFKKFWYELTEEEKKTGLEWARIHLGNRLSGDVKEIPQIKGNSPYALQMMEPVLERSEKLKILICPHSYDDDAYLCGEQIFDNNMFEWMLHLGKLSEQMLEYDWYIKPHPMSCDRDLRIIDMISKQFPNLKVIRKNVSPMQLKEEGIVAAITIAGKIGHEYPLIGIPVINSGVNPHFAFDFNWNPKSKEEFDGLLKGLKDIKKDIDEEEIYQFYCMEYLYYAWGEKIAGRVFFENVELYNKFNKIGPSKYKLYLEEWSEECHIRTKERVKKLFDWMDDWKEDVFYRIEKLDFV